MEVRNVAETISGGQRWLVSYHHNTGGASWWGDTLVRAASAEDAARKCENLIEKHSHYSEPGLRVRVYGPIPAESAGFWVRRITSVEPAS
jgi:hypothetical protein